MGIKVDKNFYRLDKFERMKWLGKKIRIKKDKKIISKWNWYRARKMSLIIKEIIERAKIKKPFFAFTLSWRKGWEHGQDLIMFKDAGIDFFNLMLYECTDMEFKKLIADLKKYLRKNQINLNLGNQIDWVVHQYEKPGPLKFYERLKYAYDNLENSGNVKGFFLHDLARSFWGRTGKYNYVEWLFSGSSIFNILRKKLFLVEKNNKKILIKNLTKNPLNNLNYLIYSSSSVVSRTISIKNLKSIDVPEGNIFIRLVLQDRNEPYFFAFYENSASNPFQKKKKRD